jgi:catechol 2,3-dioxygenase
MSDRILRLQHVEVRVPDLELCAAYYTEVLGLIETARDVRDGVQRVFLKCWDEHEHHSVVLRQAPTYGLDHLSFKLAEAGDLDYFTDRLHAASVPVSATRPASWGRAGARRSGSRRRPGTWSSWCTGWSGSATCCR